MSDAPKNSPKQDAKRLLARLDQLGLLLLSDGALPSVVSEITGAPVKGTWWGHPEGNRIYNAAGVFGDHADVMAAKLVAGKVTFVHRRLWPALIAVATEGAAWQTTGLSDDAKKLLGAVEKQGELRSDALPKGAPAGKALTEAMRALETRLLVAADEVHTESGRHAKVLRTWDAFRAARDVADAALDVVAARAALEAAAQRLADGASAPAPLPWQSARKRR